MSHDRFVSSSGAVISGHAEHVARVRQIDRDMQAEQRAWIASLRERGVKAAHPDDGWVDRDLNRVHLAYPQFNDGLAVGDVLALGWPDDQVDRDRKINRTRLVRILRSEEASKTLKMLNPWLPSDPYYWYFEEIA